MATAVVTWAMLRTCEVRLDAMKLTLSVRSFHTPDTPRTCGPAAELAFGADLAGDPGDLVGERGELVDHRVHGELQLQQLARGLDRHLLGEVTAGDRGGHHGDVPHLRRQP